VSLIFSSVQGPSLQTSELDIAVDSCCVDVSNEEAGKQGVVDIALFLTITSLNLLKSWLLIVF